MIKTLSRCIRSSSAAFAVLLVMWGVFFSPTSFADTGVIAVSVTDAENKRPVVSAKIRVKPRGAPVIEALTDSQGEARIDGLVSGLYEISVSQAGYRTSQIPSLRVIADKATPLTLALSPARREVEETIVVANPVGIVSQSSVGTSYLDREALRSAAGSGSDVLRALDGLPGLFSSGEFASFTVRGNGPRDNLILVDGIPFDNVVHFSESFGEQEDLEGGGRYSVFAPNIISGAEFQPGGWNAAYGGRAGSLLKLEVAEGNRDTAAYTARFDIAGIEVGYDGPSGFHEGTSILISARSLDFGQLFETIGVDDIGTPKVTDIIFKSSSQLGAKDKLNFLAIYAPEEFTRDIDNVLASDEDDPGNFEDINLEDSETDNALYAITWTRLLGDSAELVNQLYYRLYDEQSASGEAYPDLVPLDTPADQIPVREDILVSSREETEVGLRTDFSIDNAFGRFFSGIRATYYDLAFSLSLDDDWIRYIYDESDFRPDPDQRYLVLTPDAVDNRFEESGQSYAAYADQVFIFDDWDVRAGLRLDRDELSDEDLFSPRVGASWQLSDTTRLSATAGRYYQAPLFNDRARDESNVALENEQIDQLSIGIKYLIDDNIEFFVEPYYQRLQNLVVDQDGVSQTSANAGEGESFGFDAALSRRFSDGWSANFNYSYNEARVKDSPDSDFYDADFSRPHSLSVGGIWEINARWKLSARWKWASGAPRDSFVVYDDVLGTGEPLRFSKEITERNRDRFSGFHSLNFRVDYRKAFGKTNLIAFLDVINAYGADNPSSSDFNERTGEDTVEDGDSFPLIGLRLEW